MTITVSPKAFISSSTFSQKEHLKNEFLHIMNKLYQFEILKPLLDISATLCAKKRLVFKIEPKEAYHLDHGHCITVESDREKRYTISIKKISSDVIIHEIGHMVERECNMRLDATFRRHIVSDLQQSRGGNISLKNAIKTVMIDEMKGYPNDHIDSELFTRYFQIVAMSKEVMGLAAEYGFTIVDIYKFFVEYTDWLGHNLFPVMSHYVDANIASASRAYVKKLDEIENKWTDEKIRPTLVKDSTSGKTSWSKNIKSNFD